jgi:uncharacterized protein
VNYLSEYKIAFKGLKEGDHVFEFEIDDRFFECFEGSLVQKGNLSATVKLSKQSSLMTLQMAVKGSVVMQCDRCLDDYLQPVKNQNRMYVKFGHDVEDMGDEIIVVSYDDYQLDLAYYVYELIILGLPIKHVHPTDKKGESKCNPEMMEKLKAFVLNEVEEEVAEESPIDERWIELKKLLDNK